MKKLTIGDNITFTCSQCNKEKSYIYSKGTLRTKCKQCIRDNKNEWHRKNNARKRELRESVFCIKCGKERNVSKQYHDALNTRGSGLCRSCCGKRGVESPAYLNSHEITCTKCKKKRIVSFSTYKRSLKKDNLCQSCANTRTVKAPKKKYKSKKKSKRTPISNNKIDSLAKAIKKKEKNLPKVTADDIIKRNSVERGMTDDMIAMQKAWLQQNQPSTS